MKQSIPLDASTAMVGLANRSQHPHLPQGLHTFGSSSAPPVPTWLTTHAQKSPSQGAAHQKGPGQGAVHQKGSNAAAPRQAHQEAGAAVLTAVLPVLSQPQGSRNCASPKRSAPSVALQVSPDYELGTVCNSS